MCLRWGKFWAFSVGRCGALRRRPAGKQRQRSFFSSRSDRLLQGRVETITTHRGHHDECHFDRGLEFKEGKDSYEKV